MYDNIISTINKDHQNPSFPFKGYDADNKIKAWTDIEVDADTEKIHTKPLLFLVSTNFLSCQETVFEFVVLSLNLLNQR